MTIERRLRVIDTLALAGATLGILAGLVELALGPHIRSWVGDKSDTTRLGVATITLSAIAALAAVHYVRRSAGSVGARVLVVIGLTLPGLVCFSTVGSLWYVPGPMLVLAGGAAAYDLRADAVEVRAAISRHWLAGLTAVLAAFYIVLGATALGGAGALGIIGGVVVVSALATSSHLHPIARPLVLGAAVLPFAFLTWWSIVTPLLAVLIIAIGWPALRRAPHLAARAADSASERPSIRVLDPQSVVV